MSQVVDSRNYHKTEYYTRMRELARLYEQGELQPEQYVRLCDEAAVEYGVIRNVPSEPYPDDIIYRCVGDSWAAFCEHTRIMLQTEFKVRLQLHESAFAAANWIIDRHMLNIRDAVEHIRYLSCNEDDDA